MSKAQRRDHAPDPHWTRWGWRCRTCREEVELITRDGWPEGYWRHARRWFRRPS